MRRGRPGGPRPALLAGEQRFRRRVLLAIGALLVLSISPVFGHHLPTGAEGVLAGKDHLWALCLVALHMLLEPVHFVFHGLFAAGFGYAVWDRLRARWRLHRVLASLPQRIPAAPCAFRAAARRVGVDPEIVRVVPGLPSPAFTAGWLRPRIYAAQDLPERLTPKELEAVLAHEGAHARRRDPLRLSALRFLACVLFWVPGIRALADDLADETEVLADDAASRHDPLGLASAILTLTPPSSSERRLEEGVGFNQRDILQRRVRRLAGQEPRPRSRITRRTMVAALLALGLAWASGAIVAHPLPSEASSHHSEHCERIDRPALFHLFCRGLPPGSHADPCPLHGRA